MAKRFGFFNSINGDRKYLATDLSQAFDVGISTGLKADNADNYKIVPSANMQVKMMPGGAMIFGHYLLDEEEELINLDVAHAELNRIDRIVLRYDKLERSIKTAVINGTPALTPVAPAVLRTNEQFDLVLADIYIGKAATTITAANITDMRESDLCGFIGVKGATSQIDFDAHVSETSGKHITESGSNENGSYIKFDNGTQICHSKNITLLYTSGLLAAGWTFPAGFGVVDYSVFATPTGNQIDSVDRGNITTENTAQLSSYIRMFPMPNDTFSVGNTANIQVFAIGRWK